MIITSPGLSLKGLLMGLMVASGSFARITGPLWSEYHCYSFIVARIEAKCQSSAWQALPGAC